MYRACNTATDARDRPIQDVKITDSGSLPIDHPFLVSKSSAEL